MHYTRYTLGIVLACMGSTAVFANAEEGTDYILPWAEDVRGTFTISWENDYIADSDDGYTNGARLSWVSSEEGIPKWLEDSSSIVPFFAHHGGKRYSFELGQSMFTPEVITTRTPNPNDRPYAGWLYGSVGIISDTGQRLDSLQLTVGMVGESAQAEAVQEFVHDNFLGDDPAGWDHQLKDEPGIVLSYERKWRGIYEFSPFGYGIDITPSVGGSVGNIFTHASVGTMARFGYDLPSDYGPPLIKPGLSGSDFFEPTQTLGWYLFGGVEGRAVARNIFLDGNTFRDSPSVDKKSLVGGVQFGGAITYGRTRLAYTHILRTEEFNGQRTPDNYGALTLSVRF